MVDKYTKKELSARLRKVLNELERVTGELCTVSDEILITYLEAEDGDTKEIQH